MFTNGLFSAFWAQSLDDKIGTLHQKTFRQLHFGNGKVFEADGLTAMFAMKMNVHIVVDSMVMAVAEFVTHPFSVFKHMDEMLFPEKCQSTEDPRLVNTADTVFQFAHREGTVFLGQSLGHDDAVGSGTNAVLLK